MRDAPAESHAARAEELDGYQRFHEAVRAIFQGGFLELGSDRVWSGHYAMSGTGPLVAALVRKYEKMGKILAANLFVSNSDHSTTYVPLVYRSIVTRDYFKQVPGSYVGNGVDVEPRLTQTAFFRPHSRSENATTCLLKGTHLGGASSAMMLAKMVAREISH